MTAQQLPQTVPVFPLSGALLLPFGQLPLNIFEPRYVALVDNALGNGRYMGMVQPRDTSRETVGDDGAIFEIGCLGRITEFTDPGDGRYEIVLTGVSRFAVVREQAMQHGYRRVEAAYEIFEHDLDPDDREITNRRELLSALRSYFDRHGLDADWDALSEVPDLVLVTTAAMGCPLKPQEKQLLLEAADLPGRAEQLQAILEMSLHDGEATSARH